MSNNVDNFDDWFEEYLSPDSEPQPAATATATIEKPKQNVLRIKPQPPKKMAKTQEDISNINVEEVAKKIQKIIEEMNNQFVERDKMINIMFLSVVSASNTFLLGPPGTAKTMLTQELCSRIDNANYFQWMLNKTSDPSEILGSYSIRQMENDHFTRVTTGKLPEAEIAFMDEVMKSNAPTLNTLLTIMNEHIFYNDGKPVPVPLFSLFGASNELPEDDSLDALYDRFLLRYIVDPIHDMKGKKQMLLQYCKNRQGKTKDATRTTVSIGEVKAIQKAAKEVNVPVKMIEAFAKVIIALNKKNIKPSDRRQNECMKILQASAAIQGRNTVIPEDFEYVTYALWSEEKEIEIIADTIHNILFPFSERFKTMQETFTDITKEFDKNTQGGKSSSNGTTSAVTDTHARLDKLSGQIKALIKDAKVAGQEVAQYEQFYSEVEKYQNGLINTMLGPIDEMMEMDVETDSSNNNSEDDDQGWSMPF